MAENVQEPTILEALKAEHGKKAFSVEGLIESFELYLADAPVESDGFLEGLDITSDQFKEAFTDFLVAITSI